MNLQLVGCSHHHSSIAVRERLAFDARQAADALARLRERFPEVEAVLLSTCNRVELYTAAEVPEQSPSHEQLAEFLAEYHGLELVEVFDELFERTGEEAVRHLFLVAASLDSMVLGEPQILSQVKQAYQLATDQQSAGPVTHAVFQAALKVARRIAAETSISQKRVSIPSVAVADFARQIFERFHDKRVLVIGAGEMAEETLRYLQDEGAREITVINRNLARAHALAEQWHGWALPWESLGEALVEADLVVSTTGANLPIVTLEHYRQLEPLRYQRPLVVLDLAVPRDFEPAIGDCLGVYVYTVDDLKAVCQENKAARDQALPRALAIVDEETAQFMADLRHRATGPIIQRLREGWQRPKDEELRRLFNKLPELDDRARGEISQSFDRLINKLLHPPLESLREETRQPFSYSLLDALKRLFHSHLSE
ncbi:MAG: glutamyl-tRNA reductase [Pirellulales bacterium]|nr:glutamyl-tRNA reductase [Pirellulales bacterium]